MDVGQVHSEHIHITAEMAAEYARLSGDFDPQHLDTDYAGTTPLKRPTAPGMLLASLLSGIIATRFPGRGGVLLEQDVVFKSPVFVGDTVLFRLNVAHARPDKPIVTIESEVLDSEGEIALEGRSIVESGN